MEKNISLKELKKECQRDSYDCWCSQKMLNKFSIYFTWFFSRTSVTPNKVTFLMIISGIAGGVFLAMGNYINALAGALFLYIFLVLDLTDGELARYKKIFSKRGKFLDFAANDIVFTSVFLSLSLKVFNSDYKLLGYALFNNPLVLITGAGTVIFFAFFKLSSYYAQEIDENLQNSFSKFNGFNKKTKSIVLKMANNVFYDTVVIIVAIIGIILDIPQYVLLFYGVGYTLRYMSIIFLKMSNKSIK